MEYISRDLVEHLVLEYIPNLTVMVKVKERLDVDVRVHSDPCGGAQSDHSTPTL